MRIFTRYLLGAHLGPFLFAFAALTGIITINTLARRLADLAGKGLATPVVLEFLVLSLPATIALTFPMAVLVAVLYTFSQLAGNNEITALKASGIDLKRLLLPVFIAAALLAGFMVWFNDRVLPESNHRWSRLIMDIGRKSPLFALQDQVINKIPTQDGRSFFLRAATIDRTTNRLENVVIYDVSQTSTARTVYADSGIMAFNETRTDLLLTLFDGEVREVNLRDPALFQQLAFDRQIRRIPGVANQFQPDSTGEEWRGDRELTIGMMEARIDSLRRRSVTVRREAHTAARADLDRFLGVLPEDTVRASTPDPDPLHATRLAHGRIESAVARGKDLRRQVRQLRVEVHKKYSIAAASLIFVLVGAPLAIRYPRGGVGMVIAVSLIVFAVYYVGLIGGESLADEGLVSPVVAMWTTNVLMFGLGIFGIVRMGQEQSSARGGAWEERLDRIRMWFAERRNRA